MPLLLDTTVLIDALRGRAARQRILDLRRSGEVPYICAVNVDEIARGARQHEHKLTRDLVDSLRWAPLGRDQGWRAGRWRAEFAAHGVTLGQADCLVAAAAAGIGGRLATGNPQDFPMEELVVEHWPVGE